MNTMHALRFFAEVLSGAASALVATAWVTVYVLHRKTDARLKQREEQRPSLFRDSMVSPR